MVNGRLMRLSNQLIQIAFYDLSVSGHIKRVSLRFEIPFLVFERGSASDFNMEPYTMSPLLRHTKQSVQ